MVHGSIPAVFREQVAKLTIRPMVYGKRDRHWRPLTWGQMGRRVNLAAAGLCGLGVERGGRVAIVSDSGPEWVLADLAIQIFFFKQKTAYEILECDWSSDVCSSDLLFDNPLEIALRNIGKGNVMSGQKRQPEIFIAKIERLPHAGRILIDEAKRAIITTHAHFDRFKIEAESIVGILLNFKNRHFAFALDFQIDELFGNQKAVVDHVLHLVPVDAAQNVAGLQTEFIGDTIFIDGLDFHD